MFSGERSTKSKKKNNNLVNIKMIKVCFSKVSEPKGELLHENPDDKDQESQQETLIRPLSTVYLPIP